MWDVITDDVQFFIIPSLCLGTFSCHSYAVPEQSIPIINFPSTKVSIGQSIHSPIGCRGHWQYYTYDMTNWQYKCDWANTLQFYKKDCDCELLQECSKKHTIVEVTLFGIQLTQCSPANCLSVVFLCSGHLCT